MARKRRFLSVVMGGVLEDRIVFLFFDDVVLQALRSSREDSFQNARYLLHPSLGIERCWIRVRDYHTLNASLKALPHATLCLAGILGQRIEVLFCQ
ncbi:hypothetical protein MLD38_035144 [Melastoma candidum]|uniref:Uncharacterized protein n=1 Tax=Melastoma candidum TaxID=119954 RepID=A0ACB9MDU6_9MYRT|nr:hypothetical protein MLD38_035144 [Melastoma candidum]